jgi:hypothetical protein
MDPLSSAITSLLNAIQGAPQAVSAPAAPALTALMGQDVSMLFLGPAADGGVNLALPSGQTITAQGQMPYPEGTQLLVRVLTGTGAAPVRLQMLQASPPAQPAILAPLYQGEADALAARLAQPSLPPGLSTLAELFHLLGGPENSPPASGQAQAAPEGRPPVPAALKGSPDLLPSTSLKDPQALPAADGPARTLQTLLGERPGAPAALPETWETWMKAGIKALSDPKVSPQGAPFHAAQAKEGTAFFELPLPWAPQHPLQMWVESDRRPRDQAKGGQETRRVLLGLSFTNLGETRLGLAQSPGHLQVRVWAEHPERLAAAVDEITAELQQLGSQVDLKVLRLAPGQGGAIPSVRSLVAGSTLEALG